jgi:hypothetical protein
MNWRELTTKLSTLNEAEVKKLLDAEMRTGKRTSIVVRLHQRLTTLRADRERQALLARIAK